MPIGEKTPRPDKVQMVDEIKGLIAGSTVILADYVGLDVKSLSKVRRRLSESATHCRVVKNTIFRLAVQDTPAAALGEGLVGTTAVVYTHGDPVAAAKALMDFTKGPRPIKIKSGMVEGQLVNAVQIEALAKIPSKPELLALMLGTLQSPITNLVGTLQSMMGQLVFTLQAVSEQKSAA